MISDKDTNRIKELQEENPELHYLFEELKDDYMTTISSISHELRNSLTLVISSLQLIEDSHPETAKFRHWKETMKDLSDMKDLLLNISDYNNSEKLMLSKVNISALMEDIYKTCLPLKRKTKTTFQYQGLDEPAFLLADSKKLKRAFINLIKNAFEAIEDEGTVTLNLKTTSSETIITICDDGIGISEKQIADIFNPFITWKSQGTGLGLPISKKIIEAHGGSIHFNSTLGQGTCFTIVFHNQVFPA